MYTYNLNNLKQLFTIILERNLKPEGFEWLSEKCIAIAQNNKNAFFAGFTATPRFTGKVALTIDSEQLESTSQIRKDFTVSGYTADRLSRLLMLLNWPAENKTNYTGTINQLFQSAEMNELVALYSALPLLAYPEEWVFRCTEGIRSNIGSVLEAVVCNNPFPAENLDEAAWNQLVLKAFFTDKPVEQIIGLDERANQKLADTLSDYAHERWAAHRKVNPQLWRLVGPFINEANFPDINKLVEQGDEDEKKAAIAACKQSNYPPAKALINNS